MPYVVSRKLRFPYHRFVAKRLFRDNRFRLPRAPKQHDFGAYIVCLDKHIGTQCAGWNLTSGKWLNFLFQTFIPNIYRLIGYAVAKINCKRFMLFKSMLSLFWRSILLWDILFLWRVYLRTFNLTATLHGLFPMLRQINNYIATRS